MTEETFLKGIAVFSLLIVIVAILFEIKIRRRNNK